MRQESPQKHICNISHGKATPQRVIEDTCSLPKAATVGSVPNVRKISDLRVSGVPPEADQVSGVREEQHKN